MIFSIGVRQRRTRSVELVCPRCGVDRTGAEMLPMRWASLFGCPVLPLGEHDPVVICDECGHTSDLGVLDVPTSDQLSSLLRDATVGALVLAMRSTGPASTEVVRRAAMSTLDETGFGDVAALLDAESTSLSADDARERLRRIGDELTAYGKQGFLHRVTAVALAAEPITPGQRDVLVQIGCDLGMAAPHINGVLAVASIAA